jgi:ribonucleoside-diphosphate reductase alpha chain
MTTKLSTNLAAITDIPLQDASADIWDTKYRLKTKSGIAIDGN